MNVYRLMAMCVTTCAAGLSLAACSAGITTANRGTSPSPAVSRTGSSPAASPSPAPSSSHTASASASPAATVHVNAPIRSFPIPPGAKVAFNMSCPKQISVGLSSVTPSQASTFYGTVLPRANYKITDSFTTSYPSTGAELDFTGHGYQGTIIAFANLAAAAPTADPLGPLPADLSKNAVQIMMSPPGVPDSYTCPGWPGA